jgi:hypothetical protein
MKEYDYNTTGLQQKHKRAVIALLMFFWKLDIRPFVEFSYAHMPDGDLGEPTIGAITYVKKKLR